MLVKFALSLIGLIVLIWGLKTDDQTIRWIGIGLLGASVLMRLVPKRLRNSDYPSAAPPETPPETR